MIEFPNVYITFSGICNGCRSADLELLSAKDGSGETFWALKCNHAKACTETRRKAMQERERRTDEAN